MTSDRPLLAVEGLRKLYPVGKHRIWRRGAAPSLLHAVDGVSFTIGRGETVGLVGESGCGKSTIVRLIARLLDVSDGSIRFDGEEIGRVPARQFGLAPQRAHIQMVFQDATDSLNPRFTAFRAIADPLLRLQHLSGTVLRARVEEVARLTGLPQELLSRFPHQLSGGQKARVGIARAIAVEPRLLILDEPTSALDVETEALVMAAIERLMEGRTTFIIAHRLSTVRRCDRILVLRDGIIAEQGTLPELLRHGGVFADYYRTQFASEAQSEAEMPIPA
jgi:peptide/nickel transport system ATP-binding protein